MIRVTFLAAAGLGASLFLGVAPAHADAIDGDWCHADGRRLTIKGPQLTTPGGAQITGEYDRHGFVYIVPAPEPDSGGTVIMALMGETLMRMKAPSDPDQVWRRCGKPIS